MGSPTLIPRIIILLGLAACFLLVVDLVSTRPSASPPAPRRACISEEECQRMLGTSWFNPCPNCATPSNGRPEFHGNDGCFWKTWPAHDGKEYCCKACDTTYNLRGIDSPEWYAKENEIIYFNNDPNSPRQPFHSTGCNACGKGCENKFSVGEMVKTRYSGAVIITAVSPRIAAIRSATNASLPRPILDLIASFLPRGECNAIQEFYLQRSKNNVMDCKRCSKKDLSYLSKKRCDACKLHISDHTKEFNLSDLQKFPRKTGNGLCIECLDTGRPSPNQESWADDLENLKNQLEVLPINWDNAVYFRRSYAPTLKHFSRDDGHSQDSDGSFTVEEYNGSPHANVTIELWGKGQPIRHYIRFGKHVRYDYDRKDVIKGCHPVIDMLIAYLKASKEVGPCLQCLGRRKVCMLTGHNRKECPKFHWGTRCTTKPCPTCYVPSTGECTGSHSGLGCIDKGYF